MNVISVKALTKHYVYYKKESGLGGSIKNLFKKKKLYNTAVKAIDLEIGKGELVGFIGPNGAGKTTTLKMLSGILYPTSGSLSVLGHVPSKRKNAFLQKISLVMGQKNQLWWDLPAEDSFELNKKIYCIPEKAYQQRLQDLVERLDVGNKINIQVRKLSLGERMKMELIAALLHGPEILLLDEPTIGLDVKSQKVIRKFIKAYNQESHNTIMLTSHYMKDVQELCSRLVVIDKGEIVYDGGQEQLINRYADYKKVTVAFNRLPEQSELATFGEVTDWNELKVAMKVKQLEIAKITSKMLARFDIYDIGIEDLSLEDVISEML